MGLAHMRDRGRQVYRENAIARSLLNTEIDNVLAEGMTLQSRTGRRDFDSEVEQRFFVWADQADIRGMLCWGDLQRDAYRNYRRDGDCGTILVDQGGESRLQVVPGDLIQLPDGRANSSTMADGVEVDGVARPVRFWVLDQDEYGKRKFTGVEAANFVYLANTSESLQVRGETCYQTIFPLLDQVDGYVDAVVIAARMAAVFGLIFKEQNPQTAFEALNTIQNSQGGQQKGVTIENGMMRYIGKDGDVVQVQAQQPMQQTPDFIRAMMRLLGLPFDMPLEIVMKDVSQSNLSSLRGAIQDFHRACRVKQMRFRRKWLDPIYSWWIKREVALGNFKSPVPQNFLAHEFMPRGWQFTNPVQDATAAKLEIDAGFNSVQNICAALGRDAEAIARQNGEMRKVNESNGVPNNHSTLTRDAVEQSTPDEPQKEPSPDPQESESTDV